MSTVIPFENIVNTVTICGKIEQIEKPSELHNLLIRFSITTMIASRMLWKNIPEHIVLEEAKYLLNNYWYGECVLKQAKAIVEAYRENGGEPYRHGVKSLFVFSRGNRSDKGGNRNITIIKKIDEVRYLVKVLVRPRKKINLTVNFGWYSHILDEVLEKVRHYSARIVYRDNIYYMYVSVPLDIYLNHVAKYREPILDRYAIGFDINAGFINWVIVDKETYRPVKLGKIEFWEVCSPGYPKSRIYTRVLYEIGNLFEYCRYMGVDTVFLENLYNVKKVKRRKYKSKNVNRKVTRFAKKKLLEHIALKALKYGLKVYLVDPKYSSLTAKYYAKHLFKQYNIQLRNYRHYGASYIIALRGLQYLDSKNI